jgi:hypothetical protein
LKLFAHPDSYKLIGQNSDEKRIYVDSILEDADERERIEEICRFLTGKIDTKFLTSNSRQSRFSPRFRFYWNYHILKTYAYALESETTRNFITGPKNLGKSFNFALFRNILLSNVTEDRVIYVHNPDDLFNTEIPFKWILDDLQFTFAYELKIQDPEVCRAFQQCYNVLKDAEDVQIESLKGLLSLNQKRGKRQIFLVDQQNVLSRYNLISIHRGDTAYRLEAYQRAEKLIRTIIPQGSQKVITVASMTDEGYERQNQEVQSYILHSTMPDEMSRMLIMDAFQDRALVPEQIDTILELTRGTPGEISRIIKAQGNNVSEKILDYMSQRSTEIRSDMISFIDKNSDRSEFHYKLARSTMREFSVYVDTGIPLSEIPSDRSYDMRYLRVEGLKVKSLFPAVRRALREAFSAQDIYIRLMNEQYQLGNKSMVGSLYDKFMKDAFARTEQARIEMKVQGRKPNDVRQKFTFAALVKQDLVSIDQINLKDIKRDTVFLPISNYFKDIDLVIYLPKEKTLLIMQFKYREGLYTSWLPFCKGEQSATGKQISETKTLVELNHSHEDTSLVRSESAQKQMSSEMKNEKLSAKDKLIQKFKGQVADVEIMFILGFIKPEYDRDTRQAILQGLEPDVYFWHTKEIDELNYLEFVDDDLNQNEEQSSTENPQQRKNENRERSRRNSEKSGAGKDE